MHIKVKMYNLFRCSNILGSEMTTLLMPVSGIAIWEQGTWTWKDLSFFVLCTICYILATAFKINNYYEDSEEVCLSLLCFMMMHFPLTLPMLTYFLWDTCEIAGRLLSALCYLVIQLSQVKFDFRLNFFNTGWFSISLVF